MEMEAKEFPGEGVIIFRLDDVPEPDRHDSRVAPSRADIDAVAGDRVERMEVHHILARLAVDPVDRRLDRKPAQMVAEMLCSGMEPDNRQVAADRQHHHPPPLPPAPGVTPNPPRPII